MLPEESMTTVEEVEAVAASVEGASLARARARVTSGPPDEWTMLSGRAATSATDA